MPEQATHVRGQRLQSRGLALHHVRVELRRAAHGLAGVVDDEVQAAARGQQLAAEGFHAGGMAQVPAVYLPPVAPVREVRFARVADRKSGGWGKSVEVRV